MTLLQELRNSNYSNTRPGIADLVSELMVVCRRTYDLGDSVSIFRFNLIRYECKCPKRIRKEDILLIFFTVYYAYGHTTLSIPVLV